MKNVYLTGACLLLSAFPAIADVSIRTIQTRLYYHESGRFSEPLSGKWVLRNVIIGEGDAEEQSKATLVTVVVAGAKDSYVPNITVTLVVTDLDSGASIARQEQRLGTFEADGTYYAPFLLLDTGCIPLHLEASLSGIPGTTTTVVPFTCGE
jgi:hypothetical protein